jgi:hypothetical protein
MNEITENLKAFAREVWLFLSSVLFVKNLAMLAGVVVGLFLLTNWWLGCYTSHGESVQVDDFTGMHLSDAKKQGRDKNFRFEVMDSVWMEGKPSRMIILQNPKPLSRVKEGRKIYVTITGNAEPETLPKFSDSSYDFDRYSSKLAKRGIKARVKERTFDAKQAENTILYFFHNGKKVTEQMVKSGYDVMPGDMLEFVVTERLSNEMEIPDLVCMNFNTAEFLVSTSNLNIGQVFDDGTVTDRNTAFIFKQEPAFDPAGTIQMGGQISVWLTQNMPAGCSSHDDTTDDNTEF